MLRVNNLVGFGGASGGLSGLDISSSTYDTVFLSVASQDQSMNGCALGASDGTIVILGQAQDKFFEYTLSTENDLSTASYASRNLSVSAQNNSPQTIGASSDGLRLYYRGGTNVIYQYNCSSALDLSTASYSGKNFTPSEGAVEVISCNTDKTKLFYQVGGSLYQYSMTSGDISTASDDSVSFSTASQTSSPEGGVFTIDGLHYLIINSGVIYQYDLSSAFDVSTMVYSGFSLDASGVVSNTTGVAISSDNTKLFIAGNFGTDKIYQFTV